MSSRSKRLALLCVLSCSLAAGAQAVRSQERPVDPPPLRSRAGVVIKDNLWVIISSDADVSKRPPGWRDRLVAHLVELKKKGILFSAGPVSTPDGKVEYGMIIIRAGSAADAKRIADSNPDHVAGWRHYVLHKWAVIE